MNEPLSSATSNASATGQTPPPDATLMHCTKTSNGPKAWRELRSDDNAFGDLTEKRSGSCRHQRFRYDADDQLIDVVSTEANWR